MLLTRSPLSPKSASTPWIPFDLHVLSTPPAFILSQDQTLQQKPKTTHQKQQAKKTIQTKSQTKNGSSQKTIQQKQTPTIKKQNVPKSSASKKQKQEKTKPPPKNKASPVQSHTNKTKKHTIENTNNQTTNQPKTISKGYCAKKRASLSLTDLIFGFQLISK